MESLEKDILASINHSIQEVIKERLSGYDSPLTKLVNSVVGENEQKLRTVFSEAFVLVVDSNDFKKEVHQAFQHKVAKLLVSKLEGSIEKSVNLLRSDPTIKAKMILAIENIINEHAEGVE